MKASLARDFLLFVQHGLEYSSLENPVSQIAIALVLLTFVKGCAHIYSRLYNGLCRTEHFDGSENPSVFSCSEQSMAFFSLNSTRQINVTHRE